MTEEKTKFYLIVSSAVIMGILADYLFYGKPIGISFFVFIAISIAFSSAIAKKFDQKLNKTQIIILISAIILSAEVFLKSSEFLGFFNIIGAVYLLFFAAVLFEKKDFLDLRFIKYFTYPIIFFLKSFGASVKFIEEKKYLFVNKEKTSPNEIYGVIRGIIMSVPILAILSWFLYSADLVFRAYINKIFNLVSFEIDFEKGLRIIIIFAVSFAFIGIFKKITDKEKPEKIEENIGSKKFTGFVESMTVLTLVELLFLAFIAIQFFYLFGGKSYVWGINEYITYSEYAKSGFYELIKVAIVSFLLIYSVAGSGKIETLKEKKIFRFLSAALFVEISIILMSSLKRLLLYVDGYGLTFQRFLAFGLLFWIFFVFVFFLYKIFLEKKNGVFIFMVFSLSFSVWIGINLLNPDAFIARVNIERLAQGKRLDPYYFSSLSDDAVPEIMKIFKLNIDDGIKEKIAANLDWKYAYWDSACSISPGSNPPYYPNYNSSIAQCRPILFSEKIKASKTKPYWQSFNLSRSNALRSLRENAGEIDKYQIESWKKIGTDCKDTAAKCESACENNIQIAPVDCKITCDSKKCDEYFK